MAWTRAEAVKVEGDDLVYSRYILKVQLVGLA